MNPPHLSTFGVSSFGAATHVDAIPKRPHIVYIRGCKTCGELDRSSAWGSALLAQCQPGPCRFCGSWETAVCPVEMPAG